MKTKLLIVVAILFLFAFNVFAQKAEPNRISFAKGKSSATKTSFLKNGETYEYIFGAKAGQKVKLKIVSTAPTGKFHYFSLLGDGFDFATEYDKNYDYEFTAPNTGDYLLNVNFNPTAKVTSGKFSLTLTITN
ncbi:MAG TPA: hypothetical protein PKY82_33830 [Pyrinomonadaceae bacterium]|nr:hypothetical protein [Pyrinomonadaceae bacterium]